MGTRLGLLKSISVTREFNHLRGCIASLAWVAFFTALLPPVFAQERIVLVGSGSSVPEPLYGKWAQEYGKRRPAVQVKYLPIGTSAGIKQIARGSGDFSAGETPLTAKERSAGKLVELPAVLIGIVPIYNLPNVHKDLHFSGELLAEIFLGHVKNWSAAPIAKLNSEVTLPDLPIKVIYRPAGKGSNYIFTDFLSKTSSQFHAQIGVTPSPKWPVGMPAERSSDLADKVRSTLGAIGYVEAQYAIQAKMPHGRVMNPAGHFVKATPKSIAAACHEVEAPDWNKFSASLTNAPGDDSFPIASFSFVYVRTNETDPKRAAAMADLLRWIYSDGQRVAATEGYSELPGPLLTKIKARIEALQ
jgi:phosphate transport system substrate-binding protein